jgi:hypothetical protein
MPTFRHARYGVVIKDGNLNTAGDVVIWDENLDRSSYYEFDPDLQDNNYLLKTADIDKCRKFKGSKWTVPLDLEGRPDIIAYRKYGDPDYWQFIMWKNSFADEDQVKGSIVLPNAHEIRAWLVDVKFETEKKKSNVIK